MIAKVGISVELEYHGSINYIIGLKIKRSTGYKGSICTVYLPKRLWVLWNSRNLDAERISVKAGYNGEMHLLYVGYVDNVRLIGNSFAIDCKDDLGMICDSGTCYFGMAERDIRLSTVLKSYDYGSIGIEVLDDVLLGRVRFSSKSGDVLREICDIYGMKVISRITNDKPQYYAFLTSRPDAIMEHTPHIVKCDLLKRNVCRSMNVMLTLSGVDRENNVKRITITQGEAPFRQIRRTVYGHSDNVELERIARGIMEMETSGLSVEGLQAEYGLHGSVTTDGEEDIQLYDIIHLPEGGYLRSGSYEVTGNVITIDKKGYRQCLTLGKDISENVTERIEND